MCYIISGTCIYCTFVKRGPWALHLALNPDCVVGQYSKYHCSTRHERAHEYITIYMYTVLFMKSPDAQQLKNTTISKGLFTIEAHACFKLPYNLLFIAIRNFAMLGIYLATLDTALHKPQTKRLHLKQHYFISVSYRGWGALGFPTPSFDFPPQVF